MVVTPTRAAGNHGVSALAFRGDRETVPSAWMLYPTLPAPRGSLESGMTGGRTRKALVALAAGREGAMSRAEATGVPE